jgi:hypothetical protein
MKEILRNVLALLAAAMVGSILIACIQAVGGKLYPPPPGMNFTDRAAVEQFMATLPLPAFLIVLGSYLVGVTASAWLACKLSVTEKLRQGVMIGVLFIVASVMNLTSIPHPAWFWVANLVIVPVAAWLGLRLAGQLPARSE